MAAYMRGGDARHEFGGGGVAGLFADEIPFPDESPSSASCLMRAFSLSVSCGSGLAGTGLGSAPVDWRSSTFISMLASTGLPEASIAGPETRALQHLHELRFEAGFGGVLGDEHIAHAAVVADAHRRDDVAGELLAGRR